MDIADLPPLPPEPPPMPDGAFDSDAWNRLFWYADIAQRRADLPSVWQWRHDDIAARNLAADYQANIPTQLIPTINRIADAWDALDAKLERLALALGAPALPPPPAPPPIPTIEAPI